MGYWGDLSLDGKRHFVVAGLRIQHEDKVILVRFFIPVENKTGLVVSQEVFQLIGHIASCKQLQSMNFKGVDSLMSSVLASGLDVGKHPVGSVGKDRF